MSVTLRDIIEAALQRRLADPEAYLALALGVSVSIAQFGAVGDGVTDDTKAFTRAQVWLGGRGTITVPEGTYLLMSQLVLATGQRLLGTGCSENFGTGPNNRGASCILRGFTGALATVLASGDDCAVEEIDFDNNAQGTGECVKATGSRFHFKRSSFRNGGGDNMRIGDTNPLAVINANCWYGEHSFAYGATLAGFRFDDTNAANVDPSYPLGIANVNAAVALGLDAGHNGTAGIEIGNANDITLIAPSCHSNQRGIHCKTDGVNSGPRCITIIGEDCEANAIQDIQFDAASVPAVASGGYHRLFGNRSVAVAPKILDNSTGSFILRWDVGPGTPGFYHTGATLRAVNSAAGGKARLSLFADTLFSNVFELSGELQGTTGSKARLQTRVDAGSLADAIVIDNLQNIAIARLLATISVAPTIASANTIAPTRHISFVSGVTTIKTITAPVPINSGGGQITLIPTGLWATDLTGNIALATTAVVNKALIMTYDATTTKWYPSY